jgi:hypothetical protein
MKTTPILFIGYQSLNAWLQIVDSVQPVYAALINEMGVPDSHRVRIDRLVIMLAQPVDNLVHYCRIIVGELRMVDGQPFDLDHKQRNQQALAQYKVVGQRLLDEQLTVREGVIAALKNMQFLEATL